MDQDSPLGDVPLGNSPRYLEATPPVYITGSLEEVCPLPIQGLGNHGNAVLSSSPFDHDNAQSDVHQPDLISINEYSPKISAQSTTQIINVNNNHVPSISIATPTNSIPSATPPDSRRSRDSSPTKSVTRSRNDSPVSCDTDEWIDNEFERDTPEEETRRRSLLEDKLPNDKWSKGMAKNIEWTPEGIPLIKIALISRRSRHRAG